MCGQLLACLVQSDVGDEQPDQPFAFPHRGRRVGPERGEVCRERADPGLLLVGQRPVAGLGSALVLVAGVGELAQLVVSHSLVGDEAVGGVHGEVASAGGVGGVLGLLHAHLADPVGIGGALREFG